ncbi:MAG: anaerobic ribonucleoside-triphosphate reductase activating protein [Lachnospiraceae bacterium]|nr:anaerobic ribonucleoside-triphosphate reductase activating protein [Lachnospiraceae bacterium]
MNYWKIDKEDVCNGEGLRVTLWLSGCSHKCRGCQNPQTWDENSGILFDESSKEELFRELDKDYISGLTLSGGDPLFEENLDDVLDLVNEIRLSLPQKSIWLYTGYKVISVDSEYKRIIFDRSDEDLIQQFSFESVINHNKRMDIASMCNVLIDGQYIDSQRDITLPYRGSKNQRLIDVQKSLQKGEIALWQI